jgi:rfaE bifunctional protein nucleotidyltransferase chain/domain
MTKKKIIDFEELRSAADAKGKKIVHCHGVFDILHAGHLAYFESAKKFGDILAVTVTADEFVNKGPGRPYFNSVIRANMLAALEVVDVVSVSKFPTAVPAIETLRPHFYVKGPDYRDKASDPTGAIYLEESAAENGGGKLVFTDDTTFSSSSLINMFFPVWNDDQQAAINEIKRAGGLPMIEEVLAQVAREKVIIIGEPIVDSYVFCKPEAISSKSPSISAKYLYQEDYAGGSLAVANHLADFVGGVTIMFTHGGEPYFEKLLKEKMDSRVRVVGRVLNNVPTPRKTRFIADDKVQRLFELTDLRSDQWVNHDSKEFAQEFLKLNKEHTCAIATDFGHGLFEGQMLEAMSSVEGFLALNVQTNSSNFGYNPFTKHKRFSYLSIDLKEARVAYQDRLSSHFDLAKKIRTDKVTKGAACAMTLGPQGSYFMPANSRKEIRAPAFADNVVDALGAGDAFFSITSLLTRVGAPDIVVPFIGNIFAGLKTKIIGNKSAVSRAQLIKAVGAILK